jgi:hypothetical protein
MSSDKDWTPKPCTPEIIEQARKLCQYLGATNEQMWEFFGVSKRHFYNWLEEEPELRKAVDLGKMHADMHVAESLYQRATGYSHPEDDIKMFNGEIIVTPTTKHYPPDTVACIFWLSNRQRDKWKRKPTEESHADIDRAIKELDRAKKELEVEALKKGSQEAPPVTKIEIEVVGVDARKVSKDTDD